MMPWVGVLVRRLVKSADFPAEENSSPVIRRSLARRRISFSSLGILPAMLPAAAWMSQVPAMLPTPLQATLAALMFGWGACPPKRTPSSHLACLNGPRCSHCRLLDYCLLPDGHRCSCCDSAPVTQRLDAMAYRPPTPHHPTPSHPHPPPTAPTPPRQEEELLIRLEFDVQSVITKLNEIASRSCACGKAGDLALFHQTTELGLAASSR